MDDNPIVAAIEKKIADCDAFFWDAAVALMVNDISGDYVEFGSWGANTLRLAHRRFGAAGVARHLWAYDSFEALPPAADPRDVHPGWSSSTLGCGGVEVFHRDCARFGIPRDAYTAVAGYYDETLPPLGSTGPPVDIALAYLDCNLYSSTVAALRFLEPRLKHGMIVAFDDYYCWTADDISGERSALIEFEAAHPEWNFLRFKEVNWGGLSFVVERADRTLPR